MRNLKRVLSLALALVMVLGMMVITTSAAKFTDADEITYTEAVDVISALGVINGYEAEDGTFYFDGAKKLSRAEGAALVCYLLMGKTAADKLVGSGQFTDVPADHWAAGEIDYCYNLGFISGNGDGTFSPDGPLTSIGFGRMLLGALGYDGVIEGYKGTNWATAISSDMIDIGLDVKGVSMDAQLTREQAAQMAFQALTKTLVKYDTKGTSITVNGMEIVSGASTAEPQTYVEALGYDYTTGANDASAGDTIQFCEKYFSNLAKQTGAGYNADAYGRPGYTWVYGTKPTDNIFVVQTPVLTYTTNMTAAPQAAAVAKALKGYTYGASGATKWVDGYATANNISAASGVSALTATGTVVEVYAGVNKVVTDVVVVNTYVGTIASHVDAVKDTDGEITAKEYVTITEGKTANPDGANTNKVETTAFAEADEGKTVVLYNVAYVDTNGDDTRDAYVAQSVVAASKVENVAVKAYDAASITTTAKYPLSANAATRLDTTPTMTGGATYTYYFDAYGNIIDGISYTAVNTSINGIVYATGAATGPAVTADGDVYYVKVVHLDGTKETIATTQANSSAVSGAGFYMMSKDNTGKMKFEAATDNKLLTNAVGNLNKANNELYATDAITVAQATTKVFKTNDSTLTLDGAGKAYLTADTRYVFINAKNEVEVVTGGISTSITGATGGSTYTILVSKNDTVNLEVEAIIFAGLGYNEISASDAIVYVNGNTATGVVLAGTAEYSTYDIYALDGTKTSVPMASQPDANAFYTYKTDAAGVYTLTKITTAPAATGTSVYYASNATATTYGTLLSVDDSGADFADKEAATAVIIDLDNAAEVSTLKDITDATALDAGFLFVNGKITTIFVTDVD